jgi:hypothetical protein
MGTRFDSLTTPHSLGPRRQSPKVSFDRFGGGVEQSPGRVSIAGELRMPWLPPFLQALGHIQKVQATLIEHLDDEVMGLPVSKFNLAVLLKRFRLRGELDG